MEEHYYWPRITKYVKKWVDSYNICQHAKEGRKNTRLYNPYPTLEVPWKDMNVYFVLRLSRIEKGNNSIFIFVYISLKMTHFIPCEKLVMQKT